MRVSNRPVTLSCLAPFFGAMRTLQGVFVAVLSPLQANVTPEELEELEAVEDWLEMMCLLDEAEAEHMACLVGEQVSSRTREAASL